MKKYRTAATLSRRNNRRKQYQRQRGNSRPDQGTDFEISSPRSFTPSSTDHATNSGRGSFFSEKNDGDHIASTGARDVDFKRKQAPPAPHKKITAKRKGEQSDQRKGKKSSDEPLEGGKRESRRGESISSREDEAQLSYIIDANEPGREEEEEEYPISQHDDEDEKKDDAGNQDDEDDESEANRIKWGTQMLSIIIWVSRGYCLRRNETQ